MRRPLPFAFLLLALAAYGVAGCGLRDIMVGPRAHYTITTSGPEGNAETQAYLQTVMNSRIAVLPAPPDDAAERDRHGAFMARTVQADLLKALHAQGYYAAHVDFVPEDGEFTGTYHIHYGPRYNIATAEVIPAAYDLGMKVGPGEVLAAEAVLTAQAELYAAIQKDHCYFTLNVENRVRLDDAAATGDVTFAVEAGDEATFGATAFEGRGRVRESYLRRLQPWKDGECFRREKVEDYKTRLLQTGLFARAEALLPDTPDAAGRVPVTMDLRTRAHRSLSAGASYYSDTGAGVVLGWEHRNLLGAAEKLSATMTLSLIKQGIDTEFIKPYFLRPDQNLSLTASLKREDTDAYEEGGLKIGARLRRNIARGLSSSTGLDLSATRVDDKTTRGSRTYGLVSLPQGISYDTRNDALEPRRGVFLNATAEPFFDLLDESNPFFRTQFSGATYWDIDGAGKFVLAGRAGIGSIWGTATSDVPASKRFYAGGGGSARGFGYQEVGPKRNGEPTGGRSLAQMSLELRSRVSQKFGIVTFVDAASVSEESTPDFSALAVGAGMGVRYYTDFGPIRFDVATPLSERGDADSRYQFYISIGQAF